MFGYIEHTIYTNLDKRMQSEYLGMTYVFMNSVANVVVFTCVIGVMLWLGI